MRQKKVYLEIGFKSGSCFQVPVKSYTYTANYGGAKSLTWEGFENPKIVHVDMNEVEYIRTVK